MTHYAGLGYEFVGEDDEGTIHYRVEQRGYCRMAVQKYEEIMGEAEIAAIPVQPRGARRLSAGVVRVFFHFYYL